MSKSCAKMRMKVLATLDTAKHRAGIRGLEMGVNLTIVHVTELPVHVMWAQ